MKLEEFLFKYLHIGWGEVPPGTHESQHIIIGTCGECKFWKKGTNPHNSICQLVVREGVWLAGDGCQAWEKKEGE